jgi:hypothetical protein
MDIIDQLNELDQEFNQVLDQELTELIDNMECAA